jgi:hypothetical protein
VCLIFLDDIYLKHSHSDTRFRASYFQGARIKARISCRYCCPILTKTGMCEQILFKSQILILNKNSFSDSTVVSWVASKERTVRV